MNEVYAIGKNFRISAKKVRLIAHNLRGKQAQNAIESLRFEPRKAAIPLSKVVRSALANGEKNKGLKGDKLFIKEVLVNEGTTMKRFRPVSRGAAHRILKRSSHIKVVLEEK